MKSLTFKPTDKIKLTTTDTFVDDFASYLDSILKYWSKNFKDSPLTVTKTSDKSAEVLTDNRDNQNGLYNTLKPSADKKNIQISETINGYKVEWIAQPQSQTDDKSKKTEPKKQEKTQTKKNKTDDNSGDESDEAKSILGAMLDPVASSISSAMKGMVKSHYVTDKKLMEEIQRIKELL